MDANIKLSFPQLLELVKKLPGEQKLKLSKELEKETIQSKLTELLTSFRTDDLAIDEITAEVEKVRQNEYDQRTSH
jgi:hypothetical protein